MQRVQARRARLSASEHGARPDVWRRGGSRCPQPQEPPQQPPPAAVCPKLGADCVPCVAKTENCFCTFALAAVGAVRRLAVPDELLEVRLALHADVFVDRHRSRSVDIRPDVGGPAAADARRPDRRRSSRSSPGTSTGCGRPLPTSAPGRWMMTRDAEAWIAGGARGDRRAPLRRVLRDGAVIGSTSYLNVVPEHLRLEIGHTWNTPVAWGTGANTDAKYLLLRHAFEVLGARASSSRPTRRTSAPAPRWPRSRPSSRGSTASTWSSAAASAATRPGTR